MPGPVTEFSSGIFGLSGVFSVDLGATRRNALMAKGIASGAVMPAFEHVILLLSFIYALGLTHLLSGAADLIRAGARVRFSWLHAGWMGLALVIIVANWISFFDMRTTAVWSMGTILFVLVIAISNYLQAALVCMNVPEEGPVDMVAFHAEQGRRYILAAVGSNVTALLANTFLGSAYNIAEWTQQNLVVVPMLLVSTSAAIWPRGRAGATFLIAFWILWAIYFVELQAALR